MKLCEATVVAAAYERTARNQHADALALVDRALQENPRDATLIVARGTVLYEWGRVREARETLMRALSATDADLPLKLGWCCAAMGLHSEALTWMAKAADREPDSTRAQFGLATTLLNAGRPDDAQKHLEKIVSREPAHYQSLIQLGECKLGRNDLEAAERLFRSAIAAQPGNPIGWLNLSAVLDRRKLTGDAVDAVIRIGPKLVPADAKFPYENFKRVVEAPAETDRVAARKQFLRDVKKHVDAIAAKYILPDEGTYDFALMYVPAENVYYETIIKEDVGEDRQLFSYALAKRVIPVSPNSFYAYIQTILLGLRGMKVEERAQEILGELSRLRGDFEKIQENFRILGRHLNNAAGSYSETDKTMTKLDAKLSQIEQPLVRAEKEDTPALPL